MNKRLFSKIYLKNKLSNITLPVFIILLILSAISLSFFVVKISAHDQDFHHHPSPTSTPTPTQVWCHKFDHRQCIEDKKSHCSNGWQNGRCSSPTSTPTSTPAQENCQVIFNESDKLFCQTSPGNITLSGTVVTVPADSTLQTSSYIVNPQSKKTDPVYFHQPTFSGQQFTVVAPWPGIDPTDTIVEIHAGANILDQNGNPRPNCTASLDYYWYPERCPSPTPTDIPEVTQTPVPTLSPTSAPAVGGDNGGNGSGNGPDRECHDSLPGTPSNLRATALGGGQVRLDWDAVSGPVSNYVVAYGPSIGNYPYGSPNVGNVTSYIVKSLTPGGKYCFYVKAQNGCQGGSQSNVVCTNQGSGSLKVLGATDNYNPLVTGIKESYGGSVLGTTSELMGTAEVKYSVDKLPSGNILDQSFSISIPAIGLNQNIYHPQKIGDEYTVGHHEVLTDLVNGSQVYYGHNGTDVFGSLYKLRPNDKVNINQNGQEVTYKVSELLFVHKSQVDSLKTSDGQIILTTCSYTQPDYRIVIKATPIL